jgi:hypothetical protein
MSETVIHRHEIPGPGGFELALPLGTRILSCGSKFEKPMLWTAEPIEDIVLKPKRFILTETGGVYEALDHYEFIGTIHVHCDTEIYHLFMSIH